MQEKAKSIRDRGCTGAILQRDEIVDRRNKPRADRVRVI
jgi:hypothetical protein